MPMLIGCRIFISKIRWWEGCERRFVHLSRSILKEGANIIDFYIDDLFNFTLLLALPKADSQPKPSKEALTAAERTTETFIWALSTKQSTILAFFVATTGHNSNFKLS